jgi:putative aldouronate transport system permease protein
MVKGNLKFQKSINADKVFDTFNIIFMTIFMFIMVYPLYFTVIASFSDINEVGSGSIYLLPKGFTLEAYENVFINKQIWIGYKNTIIYTVCGTLYNLVLLLPTAYALSKKNLYGRKTMMWFFLITMYFSGGMVPTYLLFKNLGLLNNPLAMIVGSLSIYNLIVTRSFFETSIPNELYESANIDGANNFYSFIKIALPLSKPIIAVMALYTSVAIWNSYFNALIYLKKSSMYPLQLILRNILIMNQQMVTKQDIFVYLSAEEQVALVHKANLAQSMKYAVIFIASAPLLIAYPFVQKYFVKGVMIGSIKG